MEQASQDSQNLTNIFVKMPATGYNFLGLCWSGISVWIDFLNENAQAYWSSLYSPEKFKGSNSLYHAWNDMNEPSVFSTVHRTLPFESLHYKADGTVVEHRDIHNMYGAL